MTDKKISLKPAALTPESATAQSKIIEIQPPVKPDNSARLLTNSAFPAYAILGSYGGRDVDPAHIFDQLHVQADALLQGDMSQAEKMLLHQAVALQSMFSNLAVQAKGFKDLSSVQTLTQLALRAQSNCRATLQTLAELKNPKQVAFVKQANIAQNQQVNNSVASPKLVREEKIQPASNELLVEAKHGSKKVDTRATKKTGGADQDLAAVDAVDRTAKPAWKAKRIA